MSTLKEVILEILIKNQESVKIGSDGEYENHQGILDENYEKFAVDVEKKILGSFEDSARVVMEYLSKNNHPHTIATIENNKSVLWEGLNVIVSDEYIVD